jgi:hypothetical protein
MDTRLGPLVVNSGKAPRCANTSTTRVPKGTRQAYPCARCFGKSEHSVQGEPKESIFMKSLLRILFLIVSLCSLSAAQDLAVGLRVHPGDPVRVLVGFKTAITPKVMVRFQLVVPLQTDQMGFSSLLDLRELKGISEKDYEVSGKVPDLLASGQYRLTQIYVTIGELTRTYDAGTDFHDNVTLDVANEQHSSFPDIDKVKIVK